VNTAEALRNFIASTLVTGRRKVELTDDASLIASGVLDSMGIVQLLTFIADELHVRIPDSDVVPENFDNIAALVRLIERLPRSA